MALPEPDDRDWETQVSAPTTLGALALNYGTLMSENDYIEIYVANNSATTDVLVPNSSVVIRE